MSLYADYLKETGHLSIVEVPEGFATYAIQGTECYIQDIFVSPEHRNSKAASRMADQIAEISRQSGCKFLSGSVNTKIKDPTSSIRVLLGYGFKFHRCEPHILWFVKEL